MWGVDSKVLFPKVISADGIVDEVSRPTSKQALARILDEGSNTEGSSFGGKRYDEVSISVALITAGSAASFVPAGNQLFL